MITLADSVAGSPVGVELAPWRRFVDIAAVAAFVAECGFWFSMERRRERCRALLVTRGVNAMLVLARKEADKIVFPSLGITVELLRIQGNKARIGVTAPPEIPIVRHEKLDLNSLEFTAEENPQSKLVRIVHALRARLDRSADTLNRLHQRLETEADDELQTLVLEVFRELQALESDAADVVETKEDARRRALLVEDDDNQRQLLQSLLEMNDMDIVPAVDGQEALDYLSLHKPPDVVLLDLQLPRCSGYEFVNVVRSESRLAGLNLFAVSGTDPESLGISVGPQGVDRWFPKPLDTGLLLEAIAGQEVPPPPGAS
jgi:CheY-like chemotaxis protein/sRNA-binding carbon storage regulator CsrA